MIVIDTIVDSSAVPSGLEKDRLIMDWQERRRSRQRVRTVGGLEFAIALPTGTILREGDLLCVDGGPCVVVEAAEEEVLSISLRQARAGALIAYELGNRHLPVSIQEDRITTPYDHLIEELLGRLAMPYERRKEKFEPITAVRHHG